MGEGGKTKAAFRLALAYLGYGPFFVWAMSSVIILIFGFVLAVISPNEGAFTFPFLVSAILVPFFYFFGAIPALLTGWLTARQIMQNGECTRLRSMLYGGVSSMLIVYLLFFGLYKFRADPFSARTIGFLVVEAVFGLVGTALAWRQTRVLRRKLAEVSMAARSSNEVFASSPAPQP